jgi:photosystem II stability/assembly factor-like uncharacterized protein
MKQLLTFLMLLVGCGFSNLRAQSWTSLDGPPLATSIKDITVPTSGGTVYVAEAGYVMRSTTTGSSWVVTADPFEAPLLVQVRLDDAAKVVAAKADLIKYSADGGASWSTSTLPGLEPLRLVNVINDKDFMLLGAQYDSGKASIRISTNGGSSWGQAGLPDRVTDILDIAPYPQTNGARKALVWACGSDPDGIADGESDEAEAITSGFWISYNYGVNWLPGSSGSRQLRSIAIVPTELADVTMLVVERPESGGDKLLRSVVSGDPGTWDDITLTPAPHAIHLVRRNHADGKIYVAADSGVYMSTNSGASFSRVNNGLGADIGVLTVEPGGSAGEVYVGTASAVYRSTNSGANWTQVSSMNVSTVGSGPQVWAASRDNALVGVRGVSGSSWARIHAGSISANIQADHALGLPAGGPYFLAGVKDAEATLFKSTDLGVSFSVAYQPSNQDDGRFYRLSTDLVDSNDYVYLAGGATTAQGWKNTFFSSDRGANWYATSWTLGSGTAYVVDYIVINTAVRYAMLSGGEVLKTADGGQSWSTSLSASGTGYTLAIAPGATGTIYAGRSGGLWKSTNSGASWSQITTTAAVKRVVMHPGYPNAADHLFILEERNGGTGVSRTTNGGTNWTSIDSGLPTTNDIQATVYSGYLYAATVSGVYRYDVAPASVTGVDGSGSAGQHPVVSWDAHPAADILGYKVYRSGCNVLDYSLIATVGTAVTSYTDEATTIGGGGDGTIRYYVTAYDNHPFASDASSTANFDCDTRIERAGERGGTGIPAVYNLQPAFPNPFNPSTELRFELPEASAVRLSVFDVLGRRVADLVSGRFEAGYHAVTWDAAVAASGVYLARFNALDGSGNPVYTKTVRLVLMK